MNRMKIWLGVLVAFIALGGMAMASDHGTTQVDASIGAYLEVSAPSEVTSWDLLPGTATEHPAENQKTITPTVTSNENWQLSVKSATNIPNPTGGNYDWKGKFWSPTVQFMTNPLTITSPVDPSGQPLSDDNPLTVDSNGIPGPNAQVSVGLAQDVAYTDPIAGDYLIVLEFDAASR